ncbi:MAG: hypothetical protein AAGB93_02995 [Planctomycetota bacterium]
MHTALLPRTPFRAILPLALLAPVAAQTALVETGDTIPGVGVVTRIDDVAVNSSGEWIVEVDTDNASSGMDAAILENGVLKFQEGTGLGLALVPGASLNWGDRMAINDLGQTMYLLNVNLSSGTSEAVVLWNDIPVLQGDLTPFNAPGAPAGAVWDSIQETWFNVSDQLLVGGRLSTGEDVLAKLTLDATGSIVTEEILAIDGTTLPGHNAPIQGFSFSRRRQAINASGEVLWFVDDEQTTPGGAANTCCDSWIYRDSSPLLHESDPVNPPAANVVGTLSSVEVDLNDAGDWVAQMAQNPNTFTEDILLKNGTEVIAEEGLSLPSIPAPYVLTTMGSTPGVFLSNAGDVVWHGKWDDPDSSRDAGIFVNQDLLLQKGVSRIHGALIVGMPASDQTMEVSRSGEFLIIELELETGQSGAYLIDAEATIGTRYCDPAVANSTGLPAELNGFGSPVVSIGSVTLSATDLPNAAFGFFLASRQQGFITNPGGSEGNLCLGGAIGRYVGPGQIQNSGPSGSFALDLDLTQVPQPNGAVAVQAGETWNFQAWYRDAVGGTATSNFTNGVEIAFL